MAFWIDVQRSLIKKISSFGSRNRCMKDYYNKLPHTVWIQGEVEFRSVLYIPGMAPLSTEDIMHPKTKSIRLYVKRVFISDDFNGELVSCIDCLFCNYFTPGMFPPKIIVSFEGIWCLCWTKYVLPVCSFHAILAMLKVLSIQMIFLLMSPGRSFKKAAL